jgi:hypothetical protein
VRGSQGATLAVVAALCGLSSLLPITLSPAAATTAVASAAVARVSKTAEVPADRLARGRALALVAVERAAEPGSSGILPNAGTRTVHDTFTPAWLRHGTL